MRNRQLDGFKFRFQHTIGGYVADFACLEAMVIVEIDGSQHSEQADASRTAFLEYQGFTILRFWNTEVLTNLEGVASVVHAALLERRRRKPSPNPLPQAGEG
ncbi:DUF559 domain-containing protein [Sphingomonas sp. UYEF23]|uniref:endonuclease domain-containing protein n=1 Tax=Sphingomonas sp. UYEF23 TaxID=1756408 RepID=UPI0033991A2F